VCRGERRLRRDKDYGLVNVHSIAPYVIDLELIWAAQRNHAHPVSGNLGGGLTVSYVVISRAPEIDDAFVCIYAD
jgi:hypothetical protein